MSSPITYAVALVGKPSNIALSTGIPARETLFESPDSHLYLSPIPIPGTVLDLAHGVRLYPTQRAPTEQMTWLPAGLLEIVLKSSRRQESATIVPASGEGLKRRLELAGKALSGLPRLDPDGYASNRQIVTDALFESLLAAYRLPKDVAEQLLRSQCKVAPSAGFQPRGLFSDALADIEKKIEAEEEAKLRQLQEDAEKKAELLKLHTINLRDRGWAVAWGERDKDQWDAQSLNKLRKEIDISSGPWSTFERPGEVGILFESPGVALPSAVSNGVYFEDGELTVTGAKLADLCAAPIDERFLTKLTRRRRDSRMIDTRALDASELLDLKTEEGRTAAAKASVILNRIEQYPAQIRTFRIQQVVRGLLVNPALLPSLLADAVKRNEERFNPKPAPGFSLNTAIPNYNRLNASDFTHLINECLSGGPAVTVSPNECAELIKQPAAESKGFIGWLRDLFTPAPVKETTGDDSWATALDPFLATLDRVKGEALFAKLASADPEIAKFEYDDIPTATHVKMTEFMNVRGWVKKSVRDGGTVSKMWSRVSPGAD